MNAKFLLLIKRDFLLFWSISKIKFFNAIFLVISILAITVYLIKINSSILEIPNTYIHFTDIYFYLFFGVKYELVKTNHFDFPIIWLILEIIPFYIIGDSFKIITTKYSLFLIGRSISYHNIFVIQCFLSFCIILIYQVIICIFILVITYIFFNPNFSNGDFITTLYHIKDISNINIAFFILIQILSLTCMVLLYNNLVEFMNSIYALVIVFSITFITIYIPNYKILWINGTMFSRIIEFDISSTYIILIELILCSLFYIIGTFIGKNKEY
ncbi:MULTISPECIES: histidine kinase [Bacillus]|uniref:histidine kinase n=1 Tax=Bacillus TaxID=1386 RepID=UPI0030FC1000